MGRRYGGTLMAMISLVGGAIALAVAAPSAGATASATKRPGAAAHRTSPVHLTASGSWQAETAPLPAAPLDPGASIEQTVCPAAADCVSVGQYLSDSGTRGLIAREDGGTWSSAPAPLPSSLRDTTYFALGAVACPAGAVSVSHCVAGGVASQTPGGDGHAVLLVQSASGWQAVTAPAVPAASGIAATPASGYSAVVGISCPAAGACIAMASTDEENRAVLLEQSGAHWRASSVPLPAGAAWGSERALQLSQLACTGIGVCDAVGAYATTKGAEQAMILSLSAGDWSVAAAPLPTKAGDSDLTGLECADATSCVAVGWYQTSIGSLTPMALTGSPAGFVAETVALPGTLADDSAALLDVSCPAVSDCVASGEVENPNTGSTRSFLWSQSGDTTPAVALTPYPKGFGGTDSTVLDAVSCVSSDECGLAGAVATSRRSAAMVVLDDGGTLRATAAAPSTSFASLTSRDTPLVRLTSRGPLAAIGAERLGSAAVRLRLASLRERPWMERLARADNALRLATPPQAPPAGRPALDPALRATAAAPADQLTALLDTITCGPEPLSSPLTCSGGGATLDSHGDVIPAWLHVAGTEIVFSRPPVPGGGIHDELASIEALACPAPSECLAVGSAVNSSDGFDDGSLVEEMAGTRLGHLTSRILPLPPGALAHQSENLSDVACVSPGACIASGGYEDAGGNEQGLLAVDHAGRWTVQEAPLPPGSATDASPTLNAVGCSAGGGCLVVGEDGPYQPYGGGVGLLWTDWNGHIEVQTSPLPRGSSTPELETLWTVSCPGKDDCLAGGSYHDSHFSELPLIVRARPSSTRSIAVAVPGSLAGDDEPVTFLSCGAGLGCRAALWDESPTGALGGAFARASSGAWPSVVASLPLYGVPGDTVIDDLSCAQLCVAVGSVPRRSHRSMATLWTTAGGGGAWSALAAPVPASLRRGPVSSQLSSVSCPGLNLDCLAVGEAGGAPMVDTLEGGSWHAAVLPRPSGFSDVSLDELSCAASSDALSCVAVGFADEGTGQLEAILDLRTIAGGTAAPPA